MKNIKYVYPLYERRGVDVNNLEQDIYGAVKSIPRTAIAGIGILGAWGYSKIKRMLAFRRAKKEVEMYGNEFIDEIEKWHSLNDKKLAKVCASAVNNFNSQIKSLEVQYKQLAQQNRGTNNPTISEIDKKRQVDEILNVISDKLKRQVDDYFKGLNAWSVGLLKHYTSDIFTNLVDNKLSSKINKSLSSQGRANEGVSEVLNKFNFTKLSKKQVKKIEGLWLKKIMEVNAEAGDMTIHNLDKIKKKYFKGSEYNTFASIFEMDIPKGFMTSERMDEIKSYINELGSMLRYVDKELLSQVNANPLPDNNKGETNVENTISEKHTIAFKQKLNESKKRIAKNKFTHENK